MPRDRQRLTLESGPVLDLAEIIRRGSGRAGARIRAVYSFSKGEVLATELSLEEHGGTMELAFEGRRQSFKLASQSRHFGGRQWYIICPSTSRRVRVLYRPLGARTTSTTSLESGPVLDLAEIIRRRSGRAGARIRAVYSFSKGEVLATELSLEEHGGTMELAFEGRRQSFKLASQSRHFGGRQWYIICPSHRAEYGCCTDRWAPRGSQAGMPGARRLNHVDNIPQQDSAERAFNKLARTFATQVEALKRYRTSGEHRVVVHQVNVNDGGQAIVGSVSRNRRKQAGAKKARVRQDISNQESVECLVTDSGSR